MRKLSFEENLRHRLSGLPRLRHRDERSPAEGLLYLTIGAVAGLAAGVVIAQKYGGFGAITSRLRERFAAESDEYDDHRRTTRGGYDAHDHYDDDYGEDDHEDEEDYEDLSPMEELEERVLEAYHNDPILSERAVDIGAIENGIIELTGWVHSAEEAAHAVTVARGTPGVETVVNRLTVRDDDAEFDDRAERYAAGDDDLAEGHWEGQQVGIGRPRQGTSSDPDRHAGPKAELEEKWMRENEAYREAADAMEGLAERRQRGKPKGDRTGGSPVAPTGVPKGDHVADPVDAPQAKENGDTNAIRGD